MVPVYWHVKVHSEAICSRMYSLCTPPQDVPSGWFMKLAVYTMSQLWHGVTSWQHTVATQHSYYLMRWFIQHGDLTWCCDKGIRTQATPHRHGEVACDQLVMELSQCLQPYHVKVDDEVDTNLCTWHVLRMSLVERKDSTLHWQPESVHAYFTVNLYGLGYCVPIRWRRNVYTWTWPVKRCVWFVYTCVQVPHIDITPFTATTWNTCSKWCTHWHEELVVYLTADILTAKHVVVIV